jgi:multidrug efflux pump
MVSISAPFIGRRFGLRLLSLGALLLCMVAHAFAQAPVASPDIPTISVAAICPGADSSVMAATVTAPLERRLAEIAGLEQMTSASWLGHSHIQIRFTVGYDIDRAARDVQAAIDAFVPALPGDLPSQPQFRVDRRFDRAMRPVGAEAPAPPVAGKAAGPQ